MCDREAWCVSYILEATTSPEAAVNAATDQIAASSPKASATKPASSAPTAAPPRRATSGTRRRRAPGGVRDVAHRCEQRRVHHRGAGTEEDGSESPRRTRASSADEPDRRRLHPHSRCDRPLAPGAIRQCAGEELPDAPDRGVEGGQHTDPSHRQIRDLREEEREDAPRQAVVEVVHQPGLAA